MNASSKEVPRILCAGESCVVVEFGDSIGFEINARVRALRKKIESRPFKGFIGTVPTYRSLAVCFDPLRSISANQLERLLSDISADLVTEDGTDEELLIIPTCYEGALAPDLERVAAHAGLSAGEVARRHAARDYYCYMLGFVPGYPYLGGMDTSLETPRLKEPRERIPAGSVAIGGKQTGIYPIDSPGGWNLIGTTPLRVFDPDRTPPIFLNAGMWARFVPVGRAEFDRLTREVAKPDWKPDIRKKERVSGEEPSHESDREAASR
ncbi:MAG: 5-oxoprolinase subunit PxpB [Synergistaceae bacterium]|jgi:KipI family sensor histidine kinase inhibitor|nr:5-oxoprolinase subunit PxpB [Synergistaceae bacterium]